MTTSDNKKAMEESFQRIGHGPEFDNLLNKELVMGAEHADEVRDPVGHQTVNPDKAHWKHPYNGRMYYFTSEENRKIFRENPQLWVATPHGSVSPGFIEPVNDER